MKIDVSSPTWAAIKGIAESRIENIRDRLEKPLPEFDTITLRAQIKTWREILSLPTVVDRKTRSTETNDD